ncbi:ATP-binding protein [Pedobacter sp. Du54]|uniref:sensor histidine kinase n=1 Tax=Pedobacter anseongensis TaxID=3133439 RepID=UPI003098B992
MELKFEAEILKTQIEVQEQTMQTIATDLHDNIGQLLSLTTLTLSSIKLNEAEKSEKKINNSLSLLHQSIKELRDLARLLQGEQLVGIGLGEAIKQELDRLRSVSGYKLIVKNQLLTSEVSSPTKDLIILRLLQEIINNIIKHARATQVNISTSLMKEILYLHIAENGVGFNYEEIKHQKRGIGLYSIHKRIEMIDGKIEIDSKPTQGTLITIEIPYP